MSFSAEPSRMYAALRMIEDELAKEYPQISRIKEIMQEAGRELTPIAVPTKQVTVWVDGGCHGNGTNQSQMYGSFKIGDQSPVTREYGLGTNNVAEYKALIDAMAELNRQGIRNAKIKMDSQLIVNQVNGSWKVKDYDLRLLWRESSEHLKDLGATLEWVGRFEIVKQLGH